MPRDVLIATVQFIWKNTIIPEYIHSLHKSVSKRIQAI